MSPTLERAVVRVLGAKQAQLTVLRSEAVTPHFHRVQVSVGDLFARHGHHDTMWLRLWFDDHGKDHQRAFTLVDPDVPAGTAWLEFALHEGVAAQWALTATAGDHLEASLLGSKCPWEGDTPRPASEWGRTVLVGGTACIPAINALLDRWHDTEATVLLETTHDDDVDIPLRMGARHTVERFVGEGGGAVRQPVVDRVGELAGAPGTRFWVTTEAATTRAITTTLRKRHGVAKDRIFTQAYWNESR